MGGVTECLEHAEKRKVMPHKLEKKKREKQEKREEGSASKPL